MTEPSLDELLSRWLDGDLDADETQRVARLATADPRVAELQRALTRMRQSVQAAAARDDVPRRLELVLEPLLRERNPSRHAWSGWLAVAASVTAAVVIAASLMRTSPPSAVVSPAAAAVTDQQPAPGVVSHEHSGSELHAAARRGRLPAIPSPAEPAPLDVIGPLPFPPDVFGGRIAVLALPGDVTIPLRVPASCPAGSHAVLATSSGGAHSELRLRAADAAPLAGCTPLVVLDPVPADLGPTPARLVVES